LSHFLLTTDPGQEPPGSVRHSRQSVLCIDDRYSKGEGGHAAESFHGQKADYERFAAKCDRPRLGPGPSASSPLRSAGRATAAYRRPNVDSARLRRGKLGDAAAVLLDRRV